MSPLSTRGPAVLDPADRRRLGRRGQLLAGESVAYNLLEAWRGEGCCAPAAGGDLATDGCGCGDGCCAPTAGGRP